VVIASTTRGFAIPRRDTPRSDQTETDVQAVIESSRPG
jgi:hypothetical protein